VTAVTTAGLLAGLFGSAFVPAVRAADAGGPAANANGVCYNDDKAVSTGFEGTATDGGNVVQHYAVINKLVEFNVCVVGTAAKNTLPVQAAQTITVTVAGGTIQSYVPATTAGYGSYVINAAGTSMTFLTDTTPSGAELAELKIRVKAGATAGGTLKVTYAYNVQDNDSVTNGDQAGASSISSKTIKLIAASRLKASLPVQTGGSTATTTGITVNATTTDWSDAHDSDGTIVFAPTNDYAGIISGEVVEVISGNANLVTVAATNVAGAPLCANSAGTATATSDSSGVDVIVCPVAYASGTTTLTFKIDGVVVLTKNYTVVGPVASITPAASIKYVALGAALTGTSTTNIGSITAKDAAGTAVTIASYTYYVDGFESTAVADDATNGATAYAGFTNALCASGGTAGSTKSIVAKSTYYDADDELVTVSSPAWTITCTGASGIITKIEFDKASYLPSSAIKIQATATDSGGRPLGYGAGKIESGTDKSGANGGTPATTDEFSIVKQGTITLADVDTTDADTNQGIIFDGWVNGVAEWTAVSHNATGDFGLVIAIADNDANSANAVTPASFSLASTVSNILSSAVDGSLVAGAKKLKATATFGASAAGKKIAFTLENTRTGVVKTYYRKANASGVASFTLRFRGSFEVTAAYGDYMTDTVTLKK